MKIRLAVTTAVVGALALAHSGAQAATPVLDGKVKKRLAATFAPAAQDHDSDLVTGSVKQVDRTQCTAPRCGRLPFVYKPARGVRGNVLFTITWTVPGQDFDLYVAEVARDGSSTELDSCGAFAGTSEKVLVPGSSLKPGRTYALVADFYRATGTDKVAATVAFPGTTQFKTTIPPNVESSAGLKEDCGLG